MRRTCKLSAAQEPRAHHAAVIERGSLDLPGAVTSNTSTTPLTYSGTIVISQNHDATKPDDIGWDWVTSQNTSQVTVDAAKCN